MNAIIPIDVLIIGGGPAGWPLRLQPRRLALMTFSSWNAKTSWAASFANASTPALACTFSKKS